jgi:hypothetical protein
MRRVQLDNNYAVSQRVGFISLPLACLVRSTLFFAHHVVR